MNERRSPKSRVPPILPREPLTKKARAAIFAYVAHHTAGHMFAFSVVSRTLEAERMRRSDLYGWLEKHGYQWNRLSWRTAKE